MPQQASFSLQGPNPNSVLLCVSPTHKSTTPKPMTQRASFSLQSKDPIQIQCFHVCPRPINSSIQTHDSTSFLLTAVQGPDPNSVFFWFPRNSTASKPMTQHFPSFYSPRTRRRPSAGSSTTSSTRASSSSYKQQHDSQSAG